MKVKHYKFKKMENTNRLYRSRTNKMIGGVAGGLAEYFKVDPILIRLLFVVVFLVGGSGILIYIILWIIMPLEPYSKMEEKINNQDVKIPENNENNNRTFIIGVSLIIIGILFLLNTLFPQFHFKDLWPVVLIVIGAMLILNNSPENNNDVVTDENAGNKTDDDKKEEKEIITPDNINPKTENDEI